MVSTRDITGEFEDMPRGTLLYCLLFDGLPEENYNCKLFRVIPHESITVIHKGARYTLAKDGTFPPSSRRELYVMKPKYKVLGGQRFK